MIGLIICHKSLASELISTAKAIVGFDDDLFPFSNQNITGDELYRQLEETVQAREPGEAGLLMVDLRGGNTWAVAKKFAHDHPQFYVISGVNLPMIFSFLTKKGRFSPEEFAKVVERDGHRGVILEN